MNPWDFVTWLAAIALAGTAVGIFGFFLRDASSIFNREMGDGGEGRENAIESESTANGSPPVPPEDLSR